MNIDYSKITDNPKVIELLKQRIELENKIKAIDETALIKHEIELLSLPVVIVTFGCDCEIPKPIDPYDTMNKNICSDCTLLIAN
tara:strand:+ start:397 stop:648 length:252 start_codon:yes stop_codon:yes gene_type:complete